MEVRVGQRGWDEWLGERMDLVGFESNSALARASGVPESAISRWRTGASLPSITQLRRLVEPLQASLLELLVAAGHLSAQEAQLRQVSLPVPPPPTTLESIAADPVLTEDLKHLLVVQYEAMRDLVERGARS